MSEAAMEGMLQPEEREALLGVAEVRQLFRVPGSGTVAGCYVTEGASSVGVASGSCATASRSTRAGLAA